MKNSTLRGLWPGLSPRSIAAHLLFCLFFLPGLLAAVPAVAQPDAPREDDRTNADKLLTLFGFGGAVEPRPVPDLPVPMTGNEEVAGGEERQEWLFWPFVERRRTPAESLTAVRPFFVLHRQLDEGERTTESLWPLFRSRVDPVTPTSTNRYTWTIFPIWYSDSGTREGSDYFDRYLVPFYWQGGQEPVSPEGRSGDYFVLFPFLWFANDALVAIPLFPQRPQTFAAIWPLLGNFTNYWNRQHIRFVLWPLYVRSEGEEAGRPFSLTSFLWPIFGWYSGDGISGWRLWPLGSRVDVDGVQTAGYWLWPLGHYRKVQPDPDVDRAASKTVLFLPFYAFIRKPEMAYDLFFPFYGRLEQPGRITRGWALAAYNEDDDLRKGIRHHRLLWIFFRWTSDIPVGWTFEGGPEPDPMRGGGVFPFYLERENSRSRRLTVAWPFFSRRTDQYQTHTYDRTYLTPLFAHQEDAYTDGSEDDRQYVWPLYRTIENRDGKSYANAPHLFPYLVNEGADRNWAPLWSVWRKEKDDDSGAYDVHLFGPVWQKERNWLGVERSSLDLGFVRHERASGPHRPAEAHTRWFWGLLGRHRMGSRAEWELLGRRY